MSSYSTIAIRGINYILCKGRPCRNEQLDTLETNGFWKLTVIPVPTDTESTQVCLNKFREDHLDVDDVFHPDFLDTVVLTGADVARNWAGSSIDYVPQNWKTQRCLIVEIAGLDDMPPGPYVLHDGTIWEPWRSYPDTQQAMTQTFLPPVFHGSNAQPTTNPEGTLVVPSRCYTSVRKAHGNDLDGTRFVFKDIANVSDPWIQNLCEKGAIPLGKTKIPSMFVWPETGKDVDPPLNPRGGGDLTCGGSSSGSGAAIAAQPWLDKALGSDTNGSIRWPALLTGTFGIRHR